MNTQNDHCLSCPTKNLCVGAGLEDAALRALGTCMRAPLRLRRGEPLYRAGDRADGCFVVRSGSYKRLTLSPDGEERVTGFHFPGDLLGLAGLATGRQVDYVIALETATACRVEADTLPQLWRIGSGASLLRLIGEHEQHETAARLALAPSKADSRVARFLLDLSARMSRLGRDPRVVPLPMTRTDLANYLGMTLESLSRVMARLGRAGLLSAARTEVTLHGSPRLAAIACPAAE